MMVVKRSCTAVAPCSTANLGPGYDVFGLALDALEDSIRITKAASGGSKIAIDVSNSDMAIPTAAESNSAGLVIKKMATDFGIGDSLAVRVVKGVPAGFGMGSSAASAAAAAVAFDGLYSLKVDENRLVEYAAEGEIASAGAKHYDNVSASVLGGFVVAVVSGRQKPEFIRFEPPKDLILVAAVPSILVPARKTEVARSVLPKDVPLKSVVHNVSCASSIVAGFAKKDVEMIARGIDDVIVEPARKHLVPGYEYVRKNALAAGSLAVTISGAGPSMIAFMKTRRQAAGVAKAMAEGFSQAGVKSRTFVCRPSSGAKLI